MTFLDPWLKFIQKKWLTLLLAVCCSFVAVTVLTLVGGHYLNKGLVKPSGTSSRTSSNKSSMEIVYKSISDEQIAVIKDRNIFNAENIKSKEDTGKKVSDSIEESNLQIKLLGIISGGHPKNGIAILENQKKKTINSFMVDDIIMKSPSVYLHEIFPDRIIVKNDEVLEYIKIFRNPIYRNRRAKKSRKRIAGLSNRRGLGHQFAEDGLEVAQGDVKVSRLYWDNMLKRDLPRVLQDAKASPNIVDGQLKGFKLNRIRANSIYQKVGLKDGDVIKEINGIELNDTGRALKLLNRLKNADAEIIVKYNRGGADSDINLNVGR